MHFDTTIRLRDWVEVIIKLLRRPVGEPVQTETGVDRKICTGKTVLPVTPFLRSNTHLVVIAQDVDPPWHTYINVCSITKVRFWGRRAGSQHLEPLALDTSHAPVAVVVIADATVEY